ncbi:MAG: hypothetical protein ACMUHM_03935 [Thermoplasmatota archaeon]
MAELEPYWILSEALLLITFLLLMVTYILLPSRKDVKAGVKKVPGWIPALHFLMFVLSGAIIVISLALVKNNLIIILTGAILMVAIILAFIDYFITKGLINKVQGEGDVHHAVELTDHTPEHSTHHEHHVQDYHPHGHTAIQHAPPASGAQGKMVMVECPQCGGHINLPEGSHQITCPYCGLSGTL